MEFFKADWDALPQINSDEPDTTDVQLPYPFDDDAEYPVENQSTIPGGLQMGLPSNINNQVEYDPVTQEYIFSQQIGNLNFRYPASMSIEEYRDYEMNESIRQYWKQRYKSESFANQSSLIPKLQVGGEVFDKIFGSSTINIQPQGAAELIFGINISNNGNPQLPERMRRIVTFDFQEKIQMNVTGQIGDKMRIQTNYNTESTFDFENRMNLRYDGHEDEILQVVEAGDVTLPLSGTLITGSQSLFGIKTEMKFGKLRMTTVFSQQRGESSSIQIEGGAQISEFEVWADKYETNRHFFLSQYFKDRYDASLSTLPVISSGLTINRVEIWVTNKTGNFNDARNIVAFLDLGEGAYSPVGPNAQYGMYNRDNNNWNSNILNPTVAVHNMQAPEVPHNAWNDLYQKMTTDYSNVRDIALISSELAALSSYHFISGQDYEKIEKARKLMPSEYTLNDKLGFISVNAALNADDVLAVAYEFTLNGEIYRVGEFSNDGPADPNTLICKLIKGTYLSPNLRIDNQLVLSPSWELMMKNVYALGAYQINPQDFILNVMYQNDLTGTAINYIPEGPKIEDGGINGEPLLRVLNLDNLNANQDPYPDGVFDFVNGVTINPNNGRIIFPVREPFGSYLRNKIVAGNPDNNQVANKYVFDMLYDSTQTVAQMQADKNKFFMKGTYTSASGSEISLNALNIPQGSVVVTAGGQQLIENQDFTVDYNMGRVTIINQGLLESGTPINISLESNSMFNIQTKTLIGTNFNYRFNNDFSMGATILNLTERPLTTKVNFGNEPISNTIWGLDGNYRSEVPFLTQLVDKLPFLETKEMSTIQLFGEFAQLIPGHSRIIDRSGTVYIDDFEGSKTLIDLRNWGAWVLASTPQHQPILFPESGPNTGLDYGKNRALLAWYSIDPLYLRNNAATPAHIRNNPDLQSSHFIREVFEREIFPNRETPNGIPTNMQVLNLAYYPSERGPYNFDLNPGTFSSGIRNDGTGLLADPKSRWGGIMRSITTNDFEEANIEFVEFWMMDPFAEDEDSTHTGGKLYFNIGNVSEDILRDGRKAFEHGLPGPNDPIYLDTTIWGVIPVVQSLVPAFDANNNNENRPYQDVGLDGLSSAMGNEQEFHASFISEAEQLFLAGLLSEEGYQSILNDPSNDDFHYHRGGDYDALELGILDRYKRFNGLEGNAPAAEQFTEDYPTSATTIPDVEDINNDNTLSEIESYYQYEIPITYQNLRIDKRYISDEIVTYETFKNGETSAVTWYQFKIPIYEPDQVIGSISDFKSIRFFRMFLKDFDEEVVLRFARLDLVRGEWRKYNASMREAGEYEPIPQPENSYFDVSAVNIEENGNRLPVNYILPPGIDRVIDPTNPQLRQLNEQAMTLRVIDLEDGDSRAAFKNVTIDIRQYKRLIMDVHAETINPYLLQDGELRVFIRLGSDFRQNYYEYEVPLSVTPPGRYDNNNENDRRIVWPDDNRVNIELEIFQEIKQLRNNANRENPLNVSINSPFSQLDQRRLNEDGLAMNKVTIVGNPNLSNVRTVMVGVRNPKARSEFSDADDDGNPKSGEIWVNELRLTDFDDEGGWAANARAMTKLADLGTVSMAGNIKTAGFGGIESKVNTRSREETRAYDISSNIELGRFFGVESRVRLPMFVGYSENISTPEFNPVDPDIPLKIALAQAPDKATRDSIKHISQNYTRRKSINFTNIAVQSKNMTEPNLLDIGNWSASYAFSEIFSRNINTEYHVIRDYRGAVNYNFSARPKNITPFRQSKSKILNHKSLRLLKDFNFFYLPQQIAFRTDINRNYMETKMRNLNTNYLDNAEVNIPATFQKNFVWNRIYDIKYDLSRALKIDFSATNMARIDEPDGRINKEDDPLLYQQWKEEVWKNFSNFGRTTQYNHIMNINWNVPINRLPLLDFTSLSLRYTGSYDWITSPILTDSIVIGNTIKNANSMQANSQINMLTLYNKVPYLKTLNQKYNTRGRGRQQAMRPPAQRGKDKEKDGEEAVDDNTEEVVYERTGVNFTAGTPRGFNHQLGTEDVEVTAFDQRGNRIFGQQKVISKDRVTYLVEENHENIKVVIKGRKKISKNYLKIILERSIVTLMGIKNVSVSYSLGAGTLLPGYLPNSRLFGSSMSGGAIAPGVPFILGWQNRNFAAESAENGWLTGDPILNTAFSMNRNENINIRSSIEPMAGMRIDVTANQTANRNISEFYLQDSTGVFSPRSLSISGNFSMTIMTIGTSFESVGEDDYSQTFENFKNYRITIAQRLRDQRAALDPNYSGSASEETGFPEGFGPSAQNVMIPAFLAAYTNTSPNRISLSSFPNLLNLRPNWRLTWDGLTNIEWVKKYIKTVAVNHTYRSTYNVGAYTTNLFYRENEDGLSQTRDLLDNFLPQNEIAAVSINEQFSPLLNFDMTWNNSMTTRVEMKSTRNMTLSFANQQLSEMRNQEYIIGAGYRFSQVAIFISGREFKSDLTVRFDFSYRENRSIIRQIDGLGATQPTSGQRVIGIKTNADYVLSDRFNVRAFIDYTNNKPFISNSYPTSNWNFGFSVRFQLAG